MPKATAIFDADDSRLQQSIKRIDRNLLATEKRFKEIGGFAVKLFAAPAAAIAALGLGIGAVLNKAGDKLDQSFNSGAAVADLVVLEQEFNNAGKSAEDMVPAVNKMQRALESGAANDVIAQLGLDLEELRGKTPVEQFHTLGAAINGIADPAERTAAAMAIFGKSGASMLSMFASQGFGDAAAQVGSQAELLQKNAALFDQVGESLGTAGLKTQGFFVGVADKVVPVLKPLLDRFAALDLAAMGQEIGDLIAIAAQAIQDGDIGGILLDSILISLGKVGNFLIGQFIAAPLVLGAGLASAAATFISLMLEGVARILDALKYIPGLGSSAVAAGAVRGVAASTGAVAGNLNVGAAISKGMELGKVFDTEAISTRLGDNIGDVMRRTQEQQARALKEVPTNTPTSGAQMIDAVGGTAAVSALQQIGGAFGAGGGTDPMVEANRLAREGNGLLRIIATKVGASNVIPEGGLSYV